MIHKVQHLYDELLSARREYGDCMDKTRAIIMEIEKYKGSYDLANGDPEFNCICDDCKVDATEIEIGYITELLTLEKQFSDALGKLIDEAEARLQTIRNQYVIASGNHAADCRHKLLDCIKFNG